MMEQTVQETGVTLDLVSSYNKTYNFQNFTPYGAANQCDYDCTTLTFQWTHMEIGVMTMMATVSFVLNSLVFLAFCGKSKSVQKSITFVLNLCVCNSIITTVVIPMVIVSTYSKHWSFSDSLCKLFSFSTIAVIGSTSMTLLCIAADRYYAILDPLHHAAKFSHKRTFLYLAVVWAVALMFSSAQFLLDIDITYNDNLRMCFVNLLDDTTSISVAYISIFSLFFFFFPFGIMMFFYLSIFRTLKTATATVRKYRSCKSSKRIKVGVETESHKNSAVMKCSFTDIKDAYSTSTGHVVKCYPHRDNRKGACTLFSCVVSFLLCWGPLFGVILLNVSSNLVLPNHLETLPVYLMFIWCILNPIVYVFRNKRAKKKRLNLQSSRKKYYYNILEANRSLVTGKENQSEEKEVRTEVCDAPTSLVPDVENVANLTIGLLDKYHIEVESLLNNGRTRNHAANTYATCVKYGLKPIPFTGSFYSC